MNNFEKVKQNLEESKISFQLLPVKGKSVDETVAELGIKFREGLSTLIFSVNSGERYVAVLRRDDKNINNKMLKQAVGSDNVTFANEEDLKKLGFEPGLASPILLKERGIDIILDRAVLEMNKIVCGSTSPNFALGINQADLMKIIGETRVYSVTEPNPTRQDNDKFVRVLTGDRPTGPLHLGHYLGSIKNRVELQNNYELFYLIADIQALTDNHKNPEKVASNVFQVAQDNLACGIDPEKTTIFIQSMIPEIAELTVLFMNLVSHSEVLRNPTVKTEIADKKFGETVPFGFVAYPVSQAADILFCKSNLIPVGIDQAPMIELSKEIADRFNKIYGKEIFPLPEALFGVSKNLVGTDGGSKMSKSLGNTINLIDEDEILKKKIMNMYTDPNRIHANDPGKVEGNPVFIYHDAFNINLDEVNNLKQRYEKGTVGDVEVKEKLFIAIKSFLEPIRARRELFPIDKVKEIVFAGIEKTRKVAKQTLEEVREVMKISY